MNDDKQKDENQAAAVHQAPPGNSSKQGEDNPGGINELRPRSHRVAQSAYDVVTARRDFAQKTAYGALAHKLPILVLQNGLAQASGFLLAKGKEEHLALLDDLSKVLKNSGESGCDGRNQLHETIIGADTVKTMHLTRRSLDASGWIKRYVQGVLKVDPTGNNVDDEQEGGVTDNA